MPAPAQATYSAAALVAAHTSFLALLDAGSGAAKFRVRSAADVLLAEVPMTDPAGTVNGTTGQLTLTPDGRDEEAAATGTAAYVELTDSDNTVHLALPAQSGTAPVSGFAVMNTLSVVAGAPFEILSATIG